LASSKETEGSKKDKVSGSWRWNRETTFANVDHIRDLGKKFVRELEEFFVNYHALSGKKYRILDVKGRTKARKRLEDGINNHLR
jgi:inorganic pyrophosphatase